MRILIDVNLSLNWTEFLEEHGIASEHWSPIGALDATDEQIMNYAAEDGPTVLMHDLHFSAILAATKGRKPSEVQIRAQDTSPQTIGVQVAAALKHVEAELAAGARLTIDVTRARLRLLPLFDVKE